MSKEVPYQGKVYIFPDDATPAEIQSFLASKGPPPKSVGGFASNVLTSGGNLVGGMVDAVTSPRKTFEGLTDVLAGGVELMIPGQQKHEAAANAVIDLYKNRYGSVDKALETAYTDPVGMLGDLSTLAGGAGAVARGAGAGARAANLSRTAAVAGMANRGLKTVAAVTDPINIATKPVTGTLSALGRRGGALNPMERAAVDYGMANGIDVPAGTATGNTFVKVLQAGAEHTPGGSLVADAQKTKIANQMAAQGRRLASQVDPHAVTPETAGAGVRSELTQSVEASASRADQAYDVVRQVEADPQHTRSVQTGTRVEDVVDPLTGQTTRQEVAVFEDLPLPVEVGGFKDRLRPVYQHMQQWWEPARRNASAGFQAIRSIMEGPDAVPASVAEVGLGGLKQLAREGDPRNAGLARMIIPELQTIIDDTVHAADPDAAQALRAGRQNTATQYTTQGVLDKLRQEPVQAFEQLTYARDAGINFLRDIAREKPGELPKVGRAYLEKLMDTATESGGFRHGDQLYAKWQQLGPETKRLLFRNPVMIENLDKFFLLTKKMAEQINPSRSGLTAGGLAMGAALVADPIYGIVANLGTAGLTKLLYSPAGTKLLLDGLRAPRGSRQAADLIKRAAILGARSTPPAAAAGQEKR
jgi:hypothetical protein